MSETMQVVVIYEGLKKHIKDHAEREDLKGGYEAVGFIAGHVDSDRISTAVPLHNHSSDPQATYFVEPWEQYRAERKLEEAGYEVKGTYHSHPTAEARPSQADQRTARAGQLMLIYSVAFEELQGYQEKEGTLEPVDLVFVDPNAGSSI